MDVSSFFTTTLAREELKTGANTSGSSVHGTPTLNFLDFIMARLAEGNPEKKTDGRQLLSSENPVLDPVLAPNLDSADILAVNEGVREELETWLSSLDTELTQTLALNQKALDAALAPATDGIITSATIEAGSPQLMQALLVGTDATPFTEGSAMMAKLKAILTKLETLEADASKNGGLTLTNLTPGEITDLKTKIEALLNEHVDEAMTDEQKRKALDGIYLGLIKLLQPAEQSNVAAIQAATAKKQAEMNAQVNDLAAKKPDAPKAPWSDIPVEDAPEGNNQFANMLKDFSGKKPNIDLAPKNPGVKPDLSALQGWPFNVTTSIFAPMQWSQLPFEEYGAHVPSLSVTSLGSLTNLVTQAHSATQAHPAMQVVAATISKSAATGESRNITLQLEPPELGRVEVRMNFGKDKTVKAVVVAEKPETHLMLQRDSHLLERALLDSGLDASGSELSFELADSGYNFDGNDGGSRGGNGGGLENEPEEIIETTMTWRVDPETGHMRYSVLV